MSRKRFAVDNYHFEKIGDLIVQVSHSGDTYKLGDRVQSRGHALVADVTGTVVRIFELNYKGHTSDVIEVWWDNIDELYRVKFKDITRVGK